MLRDVNRKEQTARAFASALVAMRFRARDAAISIGIPPAAAATRATRYMRDPLVQEIVAELTIAAAKRNDLTTDKVVGEQKLLAFSNMADYVRVSDDGEVTIDLTNIDREKMAAVKSVRTNERVLKRDGNEEVIARSTQITLYDKSGVLETLLKYTTGVLGKELDGANVFNITMNMPGNAEPKQDTSSKAKPIGAQVITIGRD